MGGSARRVTARPGGCSNVAARRMLRRDAALWCLKVWAVRLAQRVGIRRARVALAQTRCQCCGSSQP
jgi:hypothetical protein